MSKFLIVFAALITTTAVMAATKKPAAPAAGQFCYHRTVLSGADTCGLTWEKCFQMVSTGGTCFLNYSNWPVWPTPYPH